MTDTMTSNYKPLYNNVYYIPAQPSLYSEPPLVWGQDLADDDQSSWPSCNSSS